jgi:hypothetical protein
VGHCRWLEQGWIRVIRGKAIKGARTFRTPPNARPRLHVKRTCKEGAVFVFISTLLAFAVRKEFLCDTRRVVGLAHVHWQYIRVP